MRRVVFTALPLACASGVLAGWLKLSTGDTQGLMLLALLVTMLIVLWPDIGADSRERLRRLLRR